MSSAKASNEYLWQMIWKDGFPIPRVLALRTRIVNRKHSLTLFQQRCSIRKTLSIEIGIIMLGISKIDKNFTDLAKFA